ncbi:MAG: hypothetical protein HY898_26095 [Deltaproteobacteria bacterium]|nr:hypothetical protein [Deltaproteobacteria bacterium]
MARRNRATAIVLGVAAMPLLLAGIGHAQLPSPAASSSSSSLPPASAAPTVSAAVSAGSMASSPEQVLWLRSGGVLRGQIIEYDPGRRVVLQLATGEVRTVAWSEVARASWITQPTVASGSATSRPVPTAPARPDLVPTAGKVMVHIVPPDARLWLEERPRYDASAPWQRTCQAPCDRHIEVDERSLRIGGPELRPSNPFHVKGEGNTIKLVVRPGLESSHSWGRGLLISGISVELASGLVYALGRFEDKDGAVVGGVVGMVVGVGLLVGSLPLLGAGRTTVRNPDGERVGHTQLNATPWPVF